MLSFQEVDRSKSWLVGGKGANLGELHQIEGLRVPEGMCVTTESYRQITWNKLDPWLDELERPHADIGRISARIREIIESIPIPEELASEISAYTREGAFAVRSSATVEDLPTASFAGQQDTYLNIIGSEAILQHVSKCWASLFSERAVIYRNQNGFAHRQVALSVLLQRMVFPQVSGVLFTADPVTGHRKVVSIDATFGLGEALVSGLVTPDCYKVRDQEILETTLGSKKLAVYARTQGATEIRPLEKNLRALTDAQILELAGLGRRIEAHFGTPQDIEWCLSEDNFYILQSRPITTLFPIPRTDDDQLHVYISVGHQQMMTDAMKPLGLSVWLATAGRPMATAGGRPFVDVASDLASPARRNVIVNVLGKSDPLIWDAMTTLLERGGFEPTTDQGPPPAKFDTRIDYDPDLVPQLLARSQTAIEELRENIATRSGTDLIDFIMEDLQDLKKNLTDPQSFAVIMTAMNAAYWLNDHMEEWLGEKNTADTLSQSVDGNVTSEMGLALMDVADKIRPYPEVIAYLQQARDLEGMPQLPGGQQTMDALAAYLNKYGMRCAGEIDITKPRWSENPLILVPLILSNIRNFAAGAGAEKFARGRQQAEEKERELLARLDDQEKVDETRRMIQLVRNYAGYREYPKYAIITRYFLYKQALLREVDRLLQAGVIQARDDIYYLSLAELREAIHSRAVDDRLIRQRREDFKAYEKLTPPRVFTSDGEIITGRYQRTDLPPGAIAGLPVSAGVVEGRARVILKMEQADIAEGDILVTAYTDPSWTPLFLSIKGLVTEVGGLMTHGAVIAREYGLPAIVGVDNATRLIQDGQRIRVHGSQGYVEILREAGENAH